MNGISSSVVVFASRESIQVLQATLAAALAAAAPLEAGVEVVVNGNEALAAEMTAWLARGAMPGVRLWSIAHGDKANAWNQHVHQLWSGQTLSFYIDGYVRLRGDALETLGRAVIADAEALGGTGVPSVGRSAVSLRSQMLQDGGFHGNLCCLRDAAVAEMRDRAIRLPLGLYRTDALMGGMLCFGLDPAEHAWNHRRIVVVPEATWVVDEKHWWHPSDWQAQIKRVLRQAKGGLENQAVRHHLSVRRRAPELLPATAAEMVQQWSGAYPRERRAFMLRKPLTYWAMREFRSTSVTPSLADITPRRRWPLHES